MEGLNYQLVKKVDEQDKEIKELKNRMAKMEEVMRSNPIATHFKSLKESTVSTLIISLN